MQVCIWGRGRGGKGRGLIGYAGLYQGEAGLSTTFRVGGDLGRVGGAWRRPPSAGHSRPEARSSEGWINWGTSPDRGVWGVSPRKIF